MVKWLDRFRQWQRRHIIASESLTPLDTEKYPHLVAVTQEMSEKLGIPAPELMEWQRAYSPAGYIPAIHSVILSKEFIHERQEVQNPTIGHELTHATQDNQLNTAIFYTSITGLMGGIGTVAATLGIAVAAGQEHQFELLNHSTALCGILGGMLATAGMAIASYTLFGRRQELHADWGGGKLTSPQEMACVLEDIKSNPPAIRFPQTIGGGIKFATTLPFPVHPSIEHRVERLLQGSAAARLAAERAENSDKDSPSR